MLLIYILLLILLLYLNIAFGEWVIERKYAGDIIKESKICKLCSCEKNTTTFSTVDEMCIWPTAGCSHYLENNRDFIPAVTNDDIDTTYKINNYSPVCPANYQQEGWRILLQNTDAWIVADDVVKNTIRFDLNTGSLNFQKLWPGLLMKVQFKCLHTKMDESYYPPAACLYIKHEGELTYPWTFETITSITTTTVTNLTTNTRPTTQSTATVNLFSMTSTATMTLVSKGSSQEATTYILHTQANRIKSSESKGSLIAGLLSGLFLIVVVIILLIFCYRRRKLKSSSGVVHRVGHINNNSITRYDPSLSETKNSEIIYSQVHYEQPAVQFANNGYGNSITINQSVRNKQQAKNHNYVNAEDLTKSTTLEDSRYYNVTDPYKDKRSSFDPSRSSIRISSQVTDGNQNHYDKIWTMGSCTIPEQPFYEILETENDQESSQPVNDQRYVIVYDDQRPPMYDSLEQRPSVNNSVEHQPPLYELVDEHLTGDKITMNKYVQHSGNLYALPMEDNVKKNIPIYTNPIKPKRSYVKN